MILLMPQMIDNYQWNGIQVETDHK